MENCKRCGAIISPGFLYCGKCGCPVNPSAEYKPDIKTKKLKAFKKLDALVRNSVTANGCFLGISVLILTLAILYIINLVYALKASTPALSVFITQLGLKYEYVREGLSISYVAPELNYIITYALDWLYLTLSVIIAMLSAFNSVCFTSRLVYLIKNKRTAIRPVRLNRVQATVFRISVYTVAVFIIIAVAANIFMSCI